MTKSNAIVGRRITSPCAAAIEGVSVLNIVSHHLVAVLFLHKYLLLPLSNNVSTYFIMYQLETVQNAFIWNVGVH
jgi:hypothetical protein